MLLCVLTKSQKKHSLFSASGCVGVCKLPFCLFFFSLNVSSLFFIANGCVGVCKCVSECEHVHAGVVLEYANKTWVCECAYEVVCV